MGLMDRDYMKSTNSGNSKIPEEKLNKAKKNLGQLNYFKESKDYREVQAWGIWVCILIMLFVGIKRVLIATHNTDFDKKHPWIMQVHQLFIKI